jgi:hypothetical protein
MERGEANDDSDAVNGFAPPPIHGRASRSCGWKAITRPAAVPAASRVPGLRRLRFHDHLRSHPGRACFVPPRIRSTPEAGGTPARRQPREAPVGRPCIPEAWVEDHGAARGRPGRFARPRPPTSPVPQPSPTAPQPRLPSSRPGSARHPKRAGRPRAENPLGSALDLILKVATGTSRVWPGGRGRPRLRTRTSRCPVART